MRRAVAVLTVIACAVSMLLAGCAGGERTKSLELNRLQNDAGEFQFYGLEWESSPAAAQETLGIAFGQPEAAGGFQVYGAENAYIWKGETASVTFEYESDRLYDVTLLFMPEESEREQFWSAMKEEMFNLYGTVEGNVQASTSEMLHITTESEDYLWVEQDGGDTLMSISKFSVNGEFQYIRLNVYVMNK